MRPFEIVAACVLLVAPAEVPALAGEDPAPAPDLGRYVGSWEAEYQDRDGSNREIWRLAWNEKGTFLDFQTETWINGELAYVGSGFLFYSRPEAVYRMYLMMDNGALHESIGKSSDTDVLRFETKTYGRAFPSHDTEVEISSETMKVTYVVEAQGEVHRVERVFTRSRWHEAESHRD